MALMKPKRILVVKNRAIGDTVLLTGPLRILRKHYPNHQIHVLVRAPAGQLLEGLPYVDRVISAKEPKGKVDRLAYWMRLIRRLREQKYDFCLNFHASFRSSIMAKFLRTEICVANHHELEGRNWFSDLEVPGRGVVKPVIDRDLDLLRALGISATVGEAMPEIVLSEAEKRDAGKYFNNIQKSRIFLGIGGSRETKRWIPERYIELMQKLVSVKDVDFVMTTINSDKRWLEQFYSCLGKEPELAKRVLRLENLTLREVAKVMSQCSTYIGNDSGLKHVAVALGLSSFTFFGPEAPLEWHPYRVDRHPYAYIDGLRCRTETGKHWCSIPVCKKHDQQCMRDITIPMVWDEIERIVC
jgi:heptosyltransferase-2